MRTKYDDVHNIHCEEENFTLGIVDHNDQAVLCWMGLAEPQWIPMQVIATLLASGEWEINAG